MNCDSIGVHLVRFPVADLDVQESVLIDLINFLVDVVRDFIQKAVNDFIECHQHLSGRLKPRCLKFDESVQIHRDVTDLDCVLASIRVDNGHHVCFLSGKTESEASTSFFEHGVAVVAIDLLRPYEEVLSCGTAAELLSLGFGVGAALHEVGHLLGAFHSKQGIMSQRPNALRLCYNGCGEPDSKMESMENSCFFDNFSTCLFAHSPFFNHMDSPSQPLSVRYKISKDAVHIKCIYGILLLVIVKGTTYYDLKIYDDLPTNLTFQLNEVCWDLIQVYNIFHCVENIVK